MWLAIGLLIVGGLLLPGLSTGRRPESTKVHPPTAAEVRKHSDGNLTYQMSWTPAVEGGGPALAVIGGAVATTTNKNPFWYSFHVAPGTTLRVTARTLNTQGQTPGWVIAWLFDKDGKVIDSCGPTDQANGCQVKGTAS
jgi:hypothetical protein